VGQSIPLPPDEARHVRVLRLEAGALIELFDRDGRSAEGELDVGLNSVTLKSLNAVAAPRAELHLAVAWPKGKRAALMVEKCSELGVTKIIPVRFARGVVSKDDESEGVHRLRRIAAEAAKQCGRNDVPEILPELSFSEVLSQRVPGSNALILDPHAPRPLLELINRDESARPSLLIIGPEGGITSEELDAADRAGVLRARLGGHILRIETAAIAACALAAAALEKRAY